MIESNIWVICEDSLNIKAVEYTFDVLLQILGTPYSFSTYLGNAKIDSRGAKCIVSYGKHVPIVENRPHIHIGASDFFESQQYLHRGSLPQGVISYEDIYLIFSGQAIGNELVSVLTLDNGLITNADIVASSFFLLTNYEELVTVKSLDKRGRPLAIDSFMGKNGLLDRPLVNEYAEILQRWILANVPDLIFDPPVWNGHDFAVAITRDIDSLRWYLPFSLKALVSQTIKGQFAKSFNSIKNFLFSKGYLGRDPYDNFERIYNWEKGLGIRSSIYVMSSSLTGDSNYHISELFNDPYFTCMLDEGWEIGFHPGFRTYIDEAAFLEEKDKLVNLLNQPVYGGRQHGLRFRTPYTWRLWEDANFKYDSTIGYAEREGFKSGICTPYRPFDILENRPMNLWELPLTVMECTLDKYRFLDMPTIQDVFTRLFQVTKQKRGVFVLLWHNSYFGQENAGAYHELMVKFVEDVGRSGAYIGPAIDIINAWEQREKYKVHV
ncbi:MAG: polysaccharide deacetylase family protein [Anaerolineae bacterium]|nr:polysaccharide deacetylase family protein [Anaerolineae bacterium]